jgi:hypothetical protein
VAVQPEVVGPVLDERVHFPEGTLVHQQFDPLAGRELSALVLGFDPLLAPSLEGFFPQSD